MVTVRLLAEPVDVLAAVLEVAALDFGGLPDVDFFRVEGVDLARDAAPAEDFLATVALPAIAFAGGFD
ncbi:MAG: hypothetical protein F6K00_00990 [Leptolyngbya sp. SIOISBB]|nr:hypothetical protein [Leptolyngbya sp. SIOISBB]